MVDFAAGVIVFLVHMLMIYTNFWLLQPLYPVPRVLTLHPTKIWSTEETEDLAVDSSAVDVKTALEALSNVGTVNVTREDLGGDLFSWLITFTEPAFSAYSITVEHEKGENHTESTTLLSFPLLYAGGTGTGSGFDLGTIGSGGAINATRVKRGTLGSVSGEVREVPCSVIR